jgi:CheY-specific phosphatase CheX
VKSERSQQLLSEVLSELGYLTPVEDCELRLGDCQVIAAVAFTEVGTGSTRGTIYIGMQQDTARALAGNMIVTGLDAARIDECAAEAALELTNVVAGNLLPELYGPEREFRLLTPTITAAPDGEPALVTSLLTDEGPVALQLNTSA